MSEISGGPENEGMSPKDLEMMKVDENNEQPEAGQAESDEGLNLNETETRGRGFLREKLAALEPIVGKISDIAEDVKYFLEDKLYEVDDLLESINSNTVYNASIMAAGALYLVSAGLDKQVNWTSMAMGLTEIACATTNFIRTSLDKSAEIRRLEDDKERLRYDKFQTPGNKAA